MPLVIDVEQRQFGPVFFFPCCVCADTKWHRMVQIQGAQPCRCSKESDEHAQVQVS